MPAGAPDPRVLLSAVADALNALERAGIIADVDHDAVSTRYGFVVPVGDSRLGSRWVERMRVRDVPPAEGESGSED